MYVKEQNVQVDGVIGICNICGRITIPIINDQYRDKWGETWHRICEHLMVRDSDKNIGGFFGGDSLIPITSPIKE